MGHNSGLCVFSQPKYLLPSNIFLIIFSFENSNSIKNVYSESHDPYSLQYKLRLLSNQSKAYAIFEIIAVSSVCLYDRKHINGLSSSMLSSN